MTSDRLLRCATSYAQLLSVLRARDSRERHAIREDSERLLKAAHTHGHLTLATTWLALVWDLGIGARDDVAQALRALVRNPAVTFGISLLLGLGVAATTTLFAFVDAVLLRPLPYD